MKKIITTSLIALLVGLTATAQKKVAVFDPAGSADTDIKEIVREEISTIIVNVGSYTVLERSLINKVLEENKFQSGGLVDDSQISAMGKHMGANSVFVSSITKMSNSSNYYISCKMIDVQTARIEKQKTAQTQLGLDDLIAVVQNIVSQMFGQSVEYGQSSVQQQAPAQRANNTSSSALQSQFNRIGDDDYMMLKFFRDNGFPKYYNDFDDACRQKRRGKVLLGFGIGLTGVGLIAYVAGAVNYEASYNSYSSSYSNNNSNDEFEAAVVMVAGLVSMVAGEVLIIASIPVSVGAGVKKRVIKNSFEKEHFSRNSYTYQPKLDFGLTANGVGLTLNF